MKTFEKAELVASLLSEKQDEIQVMKFMLDSGVLADESKVQRLEAQLKLLKNLEFNLVLGEL